MIADAIECFTAVVTFYVCAFLWLTALVSVRRAARRCERTPDNRR